jgi:putative N6-adenine-specific DNA methylase
VKRLQLFAIAPPGLEALLSTELRALRISQAREVQGGIEFSGGVEHLQRVNLWSRIASRILVRVDEFHASSFHELERRAKKIDWAPFVAPGGPIRFRVTCRKSKLYHSDAVAQRLANAAGTELRLDANSDEEEAEGQLFVVRLMHDVLTISADSSGELLHRRGYRKAVAKAPVRENLGAAMLAGCGWDGSGSLIDPMCGSGTIPIEAAMIARNIAPGQKRSFAFERWPGHDAAKWRELAGQAESGVRATAGVPIVGSDRDAGAISAAVENAARAGVADDIEFKEAALSAAPYPEGAGWIVTNPPYGARVGSTKPLRNLYAQLGKIATATGNGLGLLSADRSLEAATGLRFREVFSTSNGGISVRFVAFPGTTGKEIGGHRGEKKG